MSPIDGLVFCGEVSAIAADRRAVVADTRLDHPSELAVKLGLGQDSDDAALVLAAWARWGIGALDRLEGDFAFAVWDGTRLFLVRDPLGRRPLHYACTDGTLAFASMPLTLALESRPVRPDFDRLAAYAAMLPEVGSASFFAGIERVLPGHVATFEPGGGIVQHRWWKPSLVPVGWTFDESVARVRSEVERSVAACLVKPGHPVTAQLSGGLDSGLICATIVAQTCSTEPLPAFVGADQAPGDGRQSGNFEDEVARAKDSAAYLGNVAIHVIEAPPASPLAAVDAIFLSAQRPFLNPCNHGWIDASYRAARDTGATVMLEGMIGNYTTSWDGFERLEQLYRGWRLPSLLRELAAARRAGIGSWRGVWHIATGQAFRRNRDISEHFLRRSSKYSAKLGRQADLERKPKNSAAFRLAEMSFLDPGLVLAETRNRLGLELRDPLAGRRVIETCLRIPARHFFSRGKTRLIGRALVAGKLPARNVDEPRRGLQGAGWRTAAEAARPDMLATVDGASRDPDLAELFDLPRLRTALENWPTDGWTDSAQVDLYRRRVLRAVAALRWVARVRALDDEPSRP